jgi:hypothetical protein
MATELPSSNVLEPFMKIPREKLIFAVTNPGVAGAPG